MVIYRLICHCLKISDNTAEASNKIKQIRTALENFNVFGKFQHLWQILTVLENFNNFGRFRHLWQLWQISVALAGFGSFGRVRWLWQVSVALAGFGSFGRVRWLWQLWQISDRLDRFKSFFHPAVNSAALIFLKWLACTALSGRVRQPDFD